MADIKQKIVPCLWFDKNCEEAMNFYVSVFKNSKIIHVQKYPDNVEDEHMKGMEGKVLTGIFELEGYRFMALDGGPIFKVNPSISFFLNFDPSKDKNARENLDNLWEKLSEGGKVLMPLQKYPFSAHYGWIQDKYGISWQLILSDSKGGERPFIVPSFLFVGDVCGKAEEAIKFYESIFLKAKSQVFARYTKNENPDKEGTVKYAQFILEDQEFGAMDSAHMHNFAFNKAISLIVRCKDQKEIDHFWNKLSAVPESEQCGWLKDKFGLSWQIIPKQFEEQMENYDPEETKRVMSAVLKMKKIVIADLEKARKGEA